MDEVFIAGVGMTKCGKFPDLSLKELGFTAVWNAIKDAGIPPQDIQAAYIANAYGGLITGQESIRGEVILNYCGFEGIPMINVENACASGSTAFREAWIGVASGLYDVALALGVEKLHCNDTKKSLQALSTSSDIETMGALGVQFSALYAMKLKAYMKENNVSIESLAKVVEKNSFNGSNNPNAQIRKALSINEVLQSKMIADPITLYMCTPISDGAAAAIICSESYLKKLQNHHPTIRVAASVLETGYYTQIPGEKRPTIVERLAEKAYGMANISPDDVDLAEVHDAIAPSELLTYEELGFCAKGDGERLIVEEDTFIHGKIPVNTSGGLVSRGHPVGATGLAQMAEIIWQLRGEAGARQVKGRNGKGPRFGLAQNSGGRVNNDTAVGVITIFEKC